MGKTRLDLQLSPPQSTIFSDSSRFKVAVCGRRFGKTYLAGVLLLLQALEHPHSFAMAVAPTYKQLTDPKDGIFTLLKRLIPTSIVKKCSETNLQIELKNGSVIQCRSGDAQQRDALRGGGLDFLVLDEYADLEPDVWTAILAPRLADTKGRALFIGTPKGYTHFYDLFRDAQRGFNSDNIALPDWNAWQYSTLEGGRVDPEEVERFRSLMTAAEFEQEFLAKFTSLSGRVYSNFTGERHYKQVIEDKTKDILVGWDFNTAPVGLSLVVAQKDQHSVINILSAFSVNGTTNDAIEKLNRLYPRTWTREDGAVFNRNIICCPDPAGGQANTTGVTDFNLLKKAGFIVKAPNAHVPIKDRVNNVQANLLAADGSVRLMVNEKGCETLVKTFMGQVFDEHGLPSKGAGLEHVGDAVGYLLWESSNLFKGRVQRFNWSPA